MVIGHIVKEKSSFPYTFIWKNNKFKTQTFGEALVFPNKDTGFYDKFESFNFDDIREIKQISVLENTEKYNPKIGI